MLGATQQPQQPQCLRHVHKTIYVCISRGCGRQSPGERNRVTAPENPDAAVWFQNKMCTLRSVLAPVRSPWQPPGKFLPGAADAQAPRPPRMATGHACPQTAPALWWSVTDGAPTPAQAAVPYSASRPSNMATVLQKCGKVYACVGVEAVPAGDRQAAGGGSNLHNAGEGSGSAGPVCVVLQMQRVTERRR